MFKIEVLASSSKANAYIIRDGNHSILIECGLLFKKLQQASGYRLTDLDFCLISHEHKDHSRATREILNIGVNCYMSPGTRKALAILNSKVIIVQSEFEFSHGGWWVLPFETAHDAAEPLGFLIVSPSGRKIVFATDTRYIGYKFNGVTDWMIECNYSEEILQKNDRINESLKDRIRFNHFELYNVINFFENNDLSKTQSIYLLHLSDQNSDGELFKSAVEEVTGKPVYLG